MKLFKPLKMESLDIELSWKTKMIPHLSLYILIFIEQTINLFLMFISSTTWFFVNKNGSSLSQLQLYM